MNTNEIGQNIRIERNRRSWTQKYVAQGIGTTEQNVSRWERGQTVPDTYYRQKLCDLFEMSAEQFGFFHDERKLPQTPKEEYNKKPQIPEKELNQNAEEERGISYPPVPLQKKWEMQKERWHNPGWWLIAMTMLLILSLGLLAIVAFLILENGQIRQPLRAEASQQHFQVTVNGWYPKGNILDMRSSTERVRDASPTLRVTLSSRNDHDFPFIAKVLAPSDAVHAGQTIHMYLYMPKGEGRLSAWAFAVDTTFGWWKGTPTASIPQGSWYPLSYTIPHTFHGPAEQVGIQFGSEPFNKEVTVYISTMSWSS